MNGKPVESIYYFYAWIKGREQDNALPPSHTQAHWHTKCVSDQTVAWKKWERSGGWCFLLPLDVHFEASCTGSVTVLNRIKTLLEVGNRSPPQQMLLHSKEEKFC